jgi:hypothetical protein
MAKKPIKQYATLTDEAGVEAMTVATGGAVTAGPSSGLTSAHLIQGGVSTGILLHVKNTNSSVNAALFGYFDDSSKMGSVGSTTSYPLAVFDGGDATCFQVPAGLANGTLSISSKVVASSSDSRLKILTENQELNGLAAVNNIITRRFVWKEETKLGSDVQLGFFAQDLLTVLPEAVGKPDKDGGMYGLYDRPILAACVKAIQELSAKVDEQSLKITQLQSELAALEAK